MPRIRSRSSGGYALAVILIVCAALSFYFATRRLPTTAAVVLPHRPPEPLPEFRRVAFAEILFEQDFATLPVDPTEPQGGYLWIEDARQVWADSGAVHLAGAETILGVRVIHFGSVHAKVWSALLPGTGETTVRTGRTGAPHPDVPTSFQLPVDVTARFGEGGCSFTAGDRAETLSPGQGRVLWERKESLDLPKLAARMREQFPELPEPGKEDLENLRSRLDPDGDGTVTIHARITARCWGSAHLSGRDIEGVLRDAERAGQSGDYDRAEALLRALLSLGVPAAEIAEVRNRIRIWRRDGTKFIRLLGRVRGLESSAPVVVAVRREADPPNHLPWTLRSETGEFEFHLEAGAYRIHAFPDGYRMKVKEVRLEHETEVEIEFAPGDRVR